MHQVFFLAFDYMQDIVDEFRIIGQWDYIRRQMSFRYHLLARLHIS